MCTVLSCDFMVSFQNCFFWKLSQVTSSLFDCFDWRWLTILSVPATWFIQIESQKILQFDLWHTFTSSYFFDFHICILSLSHLHIFTFTFSYFHIFILLPVFLQMLDLANFPQQWTLWNFKLLTFKGQCLERCFYNHSLLTTVDPL